MTAGALDRRITIERDAGENTPSGWKPDWQPIGRIWAGRSDISDAEKAAAGTVQGTVVSRFVVRSTTLSRDIKPKDRFVTEGLTFSIVGVKQRGRRDYLEITAEARLD
ncbi:head-tail adaptor protein [Paenirhodobacter populi]|uniref:Head-tail adaptor protein n=1 Tax=Paenirhodobacter populi TaxID=2306993 RepID=A0A443JEJ5_9RHOB|nr:head-tail adaptor protein [Sinirhodobacter populi]RWR18803.1 head-tail adaptor protein [Sinirhodobacter populi]